MSQSFLLTESHGLARKSEPVAVTASFYAEELPALSALAILDDQDKPVPFQVTDLCDAPSTGPRTRPSRHCRVHFLADLPPHGQRKYRLELREGKKEESPPHTDLQILGKGLSLGLENQHIGISLDPTTGQIFSLTHKESGIALDSPRTERWEPDSFDPNRGWPRPFDWHEQPKVTFEKGTVFFQLYRVGTLRAYPEISLHLTYRFYAGAPCLWVNTIIEINQDVPLSCLRNEEFVFRESHFTHLIWQESDGRILSRPLAGLPPVHRHGEVLKISPEAAWTGFADPQNGYAVAALKLRAASFNRFGRPVRLRNPASYCMKAGTVNGIYWSRPLIYWPQQAKRDQLLVATAGSVYAEESAYCLAAVPVRKSPADTDALYARFTDTFERLKYPIEAEMVDG
jgi:hypothetical protein